MDDCRGWTKAAVQLDLDKEEASVSPFKKLGAHGNLYKSSYGYSRICRSVISPSYQRSNRASGLQLLFNERHALRALCTKARRGPQEEMDD